MLETLDDEGLRSHEDVEPLDQIRLHVLEGLVGDLQAGEVRDQLA
jgi:hypothetical protein